MLVLNILFITLSLKMLFRQDWFQCRMSEVTEVGGEYYLGDNYETSVIFVVGGFQFIASAIALNFGYSWRAPWYTNYWFVAFATLFTVFQVVMTLYPSQFSCIWRVNCSSEVSLCSLNYLQIDVSVFLIIVDLYRMLSLGLEQHMFIL